MLKQLPNFITTLNLLCGCMGAIFAVSGDLVAAAFFVFLGIFFDFFDGGCFDRVRSRIICR